MKILLVNTYARSGGASVAAARLTTALNAQGQDACLLVQDTEGEHQDWLLSTQAALAKYRPLLDALPVLLNRKRRSPHWGTGWLNNYATRRAIETFRPDLTHVHWMNHGMLSIRDLACIPGPLVLSMHDFWTVTGGCHYPESCRRFLQHCGRCPELRSAFEHDLSRWVFHRKVKDWQTKALTVITPSRWLAERVARAPLLHARRVVVIPNAVDTNLFKPMVRAEARRKLGLPQQVPMFLFAAHQALADKRKGADLWLACQAEIRRNVPDAIALLAGNEPGPEPVTDLPLISLGALHASKMALAVNAAHAVVVPSRMENLPNIVAESLACGTPVAAFSVGGIPEMLVPEQTGMLADPYDAQMLGRGVSFLLTHHEAMRPACLNAAKEHYSPEAVANRHLRLYHELRSVEGSRA